jgi:nitrate/nitrite transporter NarK
MLIVLGFYINLPIGAVAALIVVICFHTPKHAKPAEASFLEKVLQMDLLGTALVMGSIICYILALQYGGQTQPWNSSTVIGLLVGFVVIALVFGGWETLQSERATLVPRLMKDRNVWVNSLYTFFFAGSYFVMIYYLPIYFQSIYNVSPSASGVRNLPLIISFSIAMIVSGGGITATGIATPIMVPGAAIATVAAGLLYTLSLGTGTSKWIGYQILAGVGWGLSFQVPIIVGQNTVADADIAPVTAIILCTWLYFPLSSLPVLTSEIICSFPDSGRRVRHLSGPSSLCQSHHRLGASDGTRCGPKRCGGHRCHGTSISLSGK